MCTTRVDRKRVDRKRFSETPPNFPTLSVRLVNRHLAGHARLDTLKVTLNV